MEKTEMKIAIRLDDITPDMDWKKFRRIESLLDKYQIAPLLGIVPDNQDLNLKKSEPAEDFRACIKAWEEKGWQFAQHGWRHIYTTKKGGLFPLNRFSEFAGVAEEKQRDMIRDGKKRLEEMGIKTNIFMAPAHSYDKVTLKVLKEAGFQYVTDGFGTCPYEWKGLTFLPIAFQKSRDIKKEGYTTLVFHTNTMTKQDFEDFEETLKKYKDDFISYGEYLKAPACGQTGIGKGKEYGMAVFKRTLVWLYGLKNAGK